jgi:hypothetical protein
MGRARRESGDLLGPLRPFSALPTHPKSAANSWLTPPFSPISVLQIRRLAPLARIGLLDPDSLAADNPLDPFQKGNQLAKAGPMRRDTTIELVTQLNELIKCADGSKRAKLHRLIKNLIAKATTADDVLDKDGNIIKEGTGDLSAIQEIINRLEGKPSQKLVGPDNGPVRVEYKTIEEVRMFLLERGIDSLRVPPPPMKVISKD